MPETRQRLRDFISYGLLGLVAFGHREDVIDEDLYEFMCFFKWGYIERAIDHDIVHDRINRWAQQLRQPLLARTLCVALWSHIRKPERWNGGAGPPVQYVNLRKTLVVPTPRLHEHWWCIPWTSSIPLLNEDYHSLSSTTYAVVVIDEASRIPMGVWFSPFPLTPADYGLALYTASWHPDYPDYPIRGIPEVLHLPAEESADSWNDIRCAMEWADSDVRTTPIQQSYAHLPISTENAMEMAVAALLTRQGGIRAQTAVSITLQTWHDTYFSQHRSVPVPPTLLERGVANYGLATPVAGWLLPIHGHVETRHEGFVDGQRFFAAPHGEVSTHPWNKRVFPVRQSTHQYQSFIENGFTIIHVKED